MNMTRRLTALLLTVLTATALVPASALAQGTRGGTVTMNFVNADIEGVSRAIAAIINRQIMVDPRVRGNITLYSEQPVTPQQAYSNFQSALRGQGFSLVESSGLLKVVPEADAKLQSSTVAVGNASNRASNVVLTQIFKLQYESANTMVTVLRPLISPNNTINAVPGSNTLVITDYADNLQRIGKIITAMDVPTSGDMDIISLRNTVAADVAPVVQRLSNLGSSAAPGAAGQAATVIADTRTNALLVKAPNAGQLGDIRRLVAQLDQPSSEGIGGSGIHVVYLKNADAVKLAEILRAAFPTSGSGGASSSSGSTSSSPSPVATTQTASTSTNNGASTQSTNPVSASAGPSTGGNIQADPSSNSLIITAPEAQYRQLRAVIDQLDGRRAQLYIEAMIVEVNADKFAQVGVQWQTLLGKEGSTNIIGLGSNLPQSANGGTIPSLPTASASRSAAISALASSAGFNIGLVHDFGGQYGLAALANFLQTTSDGNVLSAPNLIVLDNEEAKIVSGQNVPFVTGKLSTTSEGTSNPFTTIERKDVGLTLRVKPQIGENGTIRLTVFQENSGVDINTSGSANGPTTNKSAIETSVVVDDGALLVLGGLIRDEASLKQSKVPLLGDLPGLGYLFRSENRTRQRKNLMVFLRPIIMRSQDMSNALTAERYQYMRQEQQRIDPNTNMLLPIDGGNRLPQLDLPSNVMVPSPFTPRQAPVAPAAAPAQPATQR